MGRRAQVEGTGERTRLILDELGRARLAHQQGPGPEALVRLAERADDQVGGIGAVPGAATEGRDRVLQRQPRAGRGRRGATGSRT